MTRKLVKITGWVFDSYHLDNKMIFWIKDPKNNIIKIEDTKWNDYFYLASNNIVQLSDELFSNDKNSSIYKVIENFIKKLEYSYNYEIITDSKKSKVLKIFLNRIGDSIKLANIIENKINKYSNNIRLYNVDILPIQKYFYDKDIFPCGNYEIEKTTMYDDISWNFGNDNIYKTDYYVPNLKNICLKINFPKGEIPKLSNELKSVTIINNDYDYVLEKNEKIDIENKSSEIEVLIELSQIVKELDPDLIITKNGDSFLFPYLVNRASKNNFDLILGRDGNIPLRKSKKEGVSYFSYGRTYYRPASTRLSGRLHIDISTSFLWQDCGIHGIIEISRLCRLPLHIASRSTIGKCLTSLHLYHAHKRKLLVPWKPTLSEHAKSLRELFIADRGGLILEPEIGIHEKVAELDFVSLYPSIMYQKNISAETIRCRCCIYSENRVPELDYNICEKKKGLVPESLEIVLRKRIQYKKLKNKILNSNTIKKIYNARQTALKWILVTSFGYLGFSNAKFGRIDAHIAVCAFARNILLESIKIAEEQGFEVLSGIVDSIWIRKENATKYDYIQLKNKIEERIGFRISFEGIYKWIVFLSSEQETQIPVPNKYFGAYEDETLKIRGIENRRHDTPIYFSNFQQDILKILAEANTIKEIKEQIPEITSIYKRYILLLRRRKVPINNLIFTKQLSKNYDEYENRNTIENNALQILASQNEFLKAGQLHKYVIIDYKKRKAIPSQLINNKTMYDIERYSELLTEMYNAIIKIITR